MFEILVPLSDHPILQCNREIVSNPYQQMLMHLDDIHLKDPKWKRIAAKHFNPINDSNCMLGETLSKQYFFFVTITTLSVNFIFNRIFQKKRSYYLLKYNKLNEYLSAECSNILTILSN